MSFHRFNRSEVAIYWTEDIDCGVICIYKAFTNHAEVHSKSKENDRWQEIMRMLAFLSAQPSSRADACVKKKLREEGAMKQTFNNEQWVADLASSPRTLLYSQVSERLWSLRERWNSGYNRYSSARFSRHLSEMCRITQINVSYITEMSKKRKSGENPLKMNI